jgi:nucleotide-binding universal stress UspA family protein
MFKQILVAIDGSEGSKKALTAAVGIAAKFGAGLLSISVKERPTHFVATPGEFIEEREELAKYFADVTAEAKAYARGHGVELTTEVRSGHEVETIVRFALQIHADLLVIGFMGHSRAFGSIWGGTSQNLTKTSPCSVLVVK